MEKGKKGGIVFRFAKVSQLSYSFEFKQIQVNSSQTEIQVLRSAKERRRHKRLPINRSCSLTHFLGRPKMSKSAAKETDK